MSTPAQPACTAFRVSRTVSGSAEQPVPGMSRAGSTPSFRSASSIRSRSSRLSEFASLVVPKTASPSQPLASSLRQCARKRGRSGSSRSSNGVSTGARTPARVIPASYGSRLCGTGGSMKIVGMIAAGLAGLTLVSSLAFYLWLRHDLHHKNEKRSAELAAAIAAHGSQLVEDQKFAAALPVFARRTGGRDAGAFLNPRLGWTGDGARIEQYRAAHGPPALK